MLSLQKPHQNLDRLLKKTKIDSVRTIFEKLKFRHILVLWISVIMMFGMTYYFLQTENNYLHYNPSGQKIDNLLDSVYFSFITSTSTGFGDIVPIGSIFKILSIFQVVLGLLLLAMVTTKLVSLKQDILLSEIYDISFNQQVHRLKSSLLMFRQNLTKMIGRIDDEKIRKKELSEIYSYVSPIELAIGEINIIFSKGNSGYFTKKVDQLTAEVLLKNILQSFEMIHDLIISLNTSKFDWKKDLTSSQIHYFISLNEELFENASKSKIIPQKNMIHLKSEKTRVINALEADMKKHKKIVKNEA